MKRKEHKIIDNKPHKHCSTCNMWKDLSSFSKQNNKWDGLRGKCKSCTNKNIQYRKTVDNVDLKRCSKCKEYKVLDDYQDNTAQSDGKNNYCKACSSKYRKNSEKIQQGKKLYYHRNKERINEKRRRKYKEDIHFKIACRLRCRFNELLKYGWKSKSIMNLLGCTLEELINHIESQFREGMNWANHGHGDDKWHIDHILPCSSFDLSDIEQQKICFHYTNLQPLWQKENLSKGDKLIIYEDS